MYDIGEELWVLKRPSVVEMKRQYEEMVTRLNNGDPVPFRSTNSEKIMYLRRKRLQGESLCPFLKIGQIILYTMFFVLNIIISIT
jgi:hypothetical protein